MPRECPASSCCACEPCDLVMLGLDGWLNIILLVSDALLKKLLFLLHSSDDPASELGEGGI